MYIKNIMFLFSFGLIFPNGLWRLQDGDTLASLHEKKEVLRNPYLPHERSRLAKSLSSGQNKIYLQNIDNK